MKTAIVLVWVTVNLCFTTAKPHSTLVDIESLDEDAAIELLSNILKERGDPELAFEKIGNDQPDIEEPGSEFSDEELEAMIQEETDDNKVALEEVGNDDSLIEKPGSEVSEEELEVLIQGEPEKNEEDINEENGISAKPNVDGDLVLTPEQKKALEGGEESTAQGFLYTARRWPRGRTVTVPYQFHNQLNSKARRAIRLAMIELQRRSCIRFVQRTFRNYRNYRNYVMFIPGNGCYSYLGMVGGRQPISIGRGCEYKGIVQHEILHALGRVHEQSRPDRDRYVSVFLNNVNQGQKHNFNKMRANTQRIRYDYGSIMHYGRRAFSSNGKPTIVPRRTVRIGQRRGLSTLDWVHLRRAYCSSSEIQSLDESDVEYDDGADYQEAY